MVILANAIHTVALALTPVAVMRLVVVFPPFPPFPPLPALPALPIHRYLVSAQAILRKRRSSRASLSEKTNRKTPKTHGCNHHSRMGKVARAYKQLQTVSST